MKGRSVATLAVILVILALVGVSIFAGPRQDNQEKSATSSRNQASNMSEISLQSSAFADGESIPKRFTCEGDNIHPPLSIEGAPDGTKSFVLIVEDPDIPEEVKENLGIQVFDHWVAYNIPPSTTEIPEGEIVGTQGLNSSEETGYTGPCPPTAYEPTEHRYIFEISALDTTLDLPQGSTKSEVRDAMEGHVLGQAKLIGRYEKQEE